MIHDAIHITCACWHAEETVSRTALATLEVFNSNMFDTERYKARGQVLFVWGMVVGLSYISLVSGLLAAVVISVGVWRTFMALCACEAMFYMFWRRRAAFYNSMPPRHQPDQHDPAAAFEKFKAMIRAERIQVGAALLEF